jgi:Tol biopolymer transport system component
MPDLREVFEMTTKQMGEPDVDSWREQEKRQRRAARNRKAGAIALVAALVIGVIALATVSNLRGDSEPQPGGGGSTQTPQRTEPPLGAQIIQLDGTMLAQIPELADQAFGLRLSPDGSTIAFITGDVNGQVATIRTDGSNLTYLTEPATNSNAGDAQTAVSWSPDGTQIAYASSGDLYVIDADGSNVRQLTTDPNGDYYPAWSPDGSTIAYWNGSTTGQDGGPTDAELYTIPATGGTPTRLTNNEIPDIEPAWSPDGGQIAYFSTDRGDLRVMRADGTHDRAVFTQGNSGWAPSWSPDGTRIAFLSCCRSINGYLYSPPELEVQVLTLATGDATKLTVDGHAVTVRTDLNGPSWTPQGALLVNRFD